MLKWWFKQAHTCFHARFYVQNVLQLQSTAGVNVKLMTIKMQIANAVRLPVLDRIVQKYHEI